MKTSLVVQPFQKQTENCESSGFVGGGASCGFDVDVCAARSAEWWANQASFGSDVPAFTVIIVMIHW